MPTIYLLEILRKSNDFSKLMVNILIIFNILWPISKSTRDKDFKLASKS